MSASPNNRGTSIPGPQASASEEELVIAVAELEVAAAAAREAGRPVTAEVLAREAKGIEAQRRHLMDLVSASRDEVAWLQDDATTWRSGS